MEIESTKNRRPPGPPGLFLFGNLFEAWRDPLSLFVRTHREFGDVARLRAATVNYYLLHDPKDVHHVLVDNVKGYVKSRSYRGLKLVIGNGLLTSEGDFWRRQRKLAQPAFHRPRLAGFASAMASDTAAMLARWKEKPGGELDVHEEMMHLTFRIVARTLFSTDVDGDARAIGVAFTDALRWTNEYVESLVHAPPWFPTPDNIRFRRSVKTLNELVGRIIGERRTGAENPDDLLGMLMAVTDEETRETMTDRQLRDEIMTIILAGHETSANALSWAFYLLSTHPEVARRLKSELDAVLGGRTPELGDLGKLTYTKMVLDETLRLYPPGWIFEREAIADDEIAGYAIPKGSMVGICPWSIHRSEKLWDNPEGFDPERFLPEAVAARPKFAYLPFGGGPRMCIGNAFAMMELQIILAMVAQNYSLELVPAHPVVPDPMVTLRPRHGIRMTLRPPHRVERSQLRVA